MVVLADNTIVKNLGNRLGPMGFSLLEGTAKNNYVHECKVVTLESGTKETYIVLRNLQWAKECCFKLP